MKKVPPSTEIKKQLALKCIQAKNEGLPVAPIINKAAEKFKYSTKQVYRWVNTHGFNSERKIRSDCGKITEGRNGDLVLLKKVYHTKKHINAKESRMPLNRAIENLERILGREIDIPGNSRIHQIFRQQEISRKHARLPNPTSTLISLYPNHVHSLDFSVSNFYLDPDSKVMPIWKRDVYKNKPNEWLKKSQLRLMMITDHNSGAFYCKYYSNQQIPDIADFLFEAWSQKENDQFIFHGLPKILLIDNDKALKSHIMQRLFNYLNISVPNIEPYKPQAKGSVEKSIHIWQMYFESTFLLGYNETTDIDKINKWAFEYSIGFQNKYKHSRHGKTRFRQWYDRIGDNLVEMPSWEVYQQLLHSEPKEKTVTRGRIRFQGEKYKIKGLPNGAKVDAFIHVFLYEKNKAITVQYPSQASNHENFLKVNIQTQTVLPEGRNIDGFSNIGTVFGEYEKREQTNTQKEFEKIEKALLPEKSKQNLFTLKAKDTAKFIPKKGKAINIQTGLEFKPVKYTRYQAKRIIIQQLNRGPLKARDIEIIDSFNLTEYTEDNIQNIVHAIINNKMEKQA